MSHDSSRPPKIAPARRTPARKAVASTKSKDTVEAVPEIAPVDAARYVGEMTAELARFARRHELSTLAYFLEMAHIEAGDEAHRLESEAAPAVKRGRR